MSNTRPTWSICTGTDNLMIIKTANAHRAQLVAQSYGQGYSHMYHDLPRTDPNGGSGSCWSIAMEEDPDYFDQWDDLPEELDLEALYECADVLILDEEGKEMSLEDIQKFEGGNESNGNEMAKSETNNNSSGDLKERMLETAKDLGRAAVMGPKLATAGKVNKAAYAKFKEIMVSKGFSEETFERTEVEAIVMMLLPAGLTFAATAFEDQLPHVKHLKPALELSITETSREHSAEMLEFATSMFSAMYAAYKQPVHVTPQVRIQTDYEDLRTEKLKEIATARKLGLKTRITREKLINALKAADLQVAAEEEAAAGETEQQRLTV